MPVKRSPVFGALLAAAFVTATPALAADPKPAAADVSPASTEALTKMGAYLRTLQAFEMKADILTDVVDDGGRRLQTGGTATYKVRRPNAFAIDLVSDRKVRKLYYDGKSFTLFAPRAGYYAQTPAPPTIRAALDALDERDIEIPLEDLFRWGEADDDRDDLKSGFYVGPARIDGVETDQFAYTTGDVDWQIWIERGATPAPRTLVITSRTDPAQPQFSATMSWNVRPTLTDNDFAFVPPQGATAIAVGTITTAAKK
jgi:hypothetical protein